MDIENKKERSDIRSIRSFVLRAGRMSEAQRRSYEKLGADYVLPLSKGMLDFASLFGNSQPVTVEIGFGMGLASAIIAQENPSKNYLGLEVHRPGIGKLLWEIDQRQLKNIRIIEADAALVLESMIPDGSVDAFHIFFPDPWPKKRHHKRRLIQEPFTGLLAKKMRPKAYLYMSTDWEDYGHWALRELENTPGLKNAYEGFAPRMSWRPETKFEHKGLAASHRGWELYFIREDLS